MKKSIVFLFMLVSMLGGFRTLVFAQVTSTAKEFLAEGKNRAKVEVERRVYADKLEAAFLMNTLAKKGRDLKLPTEPNYLYQKIDPVPLQSYKVYTPWLNYFKHSIVFVIGHLDPKRLKIARWSVSLFDQTGKEVKTFAGVGHPPSAFNWNGRGKNFEPVAVGKGYVPEITLVDYYGAQVSLPQKILYLDQFIWETSRLMRAGALQASVFQPRRSRFSKKGEVIMQELSNLVNQHDTVILDIECCGREIDLATERANALKKYFSKENLRLKKIRIKSVSLSGENIFYISAIKLGAQ
ncbi:hypothetical protein K8S19_12445 [bacterium]|nr:hypothetical protein [bacterium]